MILNMNKRIEITLQNLQILEKNCESSKTGFKPTPVVCMYLIDCLLPVIDIYPIKVLHRLPFKTTFETSSELFEFLDTTIGRMKRAEYFALTKDEIDDLKDTLNISLFDFMFKENFNYQSQLEHFLIDLKTHLNEIHGLMNDPRRNHAKISYIDRTLVVPLHQIASLLEALCAGITDV